MKYPRDMLLAFLLQNFGASIDGVHIGAPWGGMLEFVEFFGHTVRH